MTGTPYLEIQDLRKLDTTVVALMSSSSGLQTTVFQSIMVSRYRNPWEGGRVPTKSTFTSVKRHVGIGISLSSGTVNLDTWQAVHSLHHWFMSVFMLLYNQLLVINLLVARIPTSWQPVYHREDLAVEGGWARRGGVCLWIHHTVLVHHCTLHMKNGTLSVVVDELRHCHGPVLLRKHVGRFPRRWWCRRGSGSGRRMRRWKWDWRMWGC